MKSPQVGIFWYTKHKLLLDSIPLANADSCGGYKNYPQGHIDRWKLWQEMGTVSNDVEYEVWPRGRVIFDIKADKFMLLADTCILRRPKIIKEIITALELPNNTKLITDLHYRCYKCLEFEL